MTANINLSFTPLNNPSPGKLSREQVAFYNAHGYLKPFDIYAPLEVARNRAYFDYLLATLRVEQPDLDTYAINGYHTRCRGIYEMATHPKILDLVEDIVGPNIICWGTHFFCKMPLDPKSVPWHQDASYWPLAPARTVTAWLAIDDADVENSCMFVIPGTHARGHLKWKDTSGPAVLNQEIEGIQQLGEPVAMELQAGQISLHADMLAHGSTPNRSSRRRCGLTVRYCPPEVEPLNRGWGDGAILCRGVDTTGHWRHNSKPPGEDLEFRKQQPIIGGN